MALLPRTRYAKCGDMDIAYQVIGDGPIDLLVPAGPFISIDSIDAEPSMYRFHRRLASFTRLIRLDHRGIGPSSRITSQHAAIVVGANDDALHCDAPNLTQGLTAPGKER